MEATFETVSLNDIVDCAREALGAAATRVAIREPEPVTVLGSPELLTRALANVMDNAVKFSGPSGAIEVSLSSTGRVASVIVTDDGPGMTDAESAHAFDRFWRAQEARSTPGYGLGLPLVRQILAAHHGRVSVASVVGVGTSVTVTLPVLLP